MPSHGAVERQRFFLETCSTWNIDFFNTRRSENGLMKILEKSLQNLFTSRDGLGILTSQ
jgi:hypothetical protein